MMKVDIGTEKKIKTSEKYMMEGIRVSKLYRSSDTVISDLYSQLGLNVRN